MNFKRVLSYFLPITIFQSKSVINKNLEVTWNNGQLVLDSKNTNFSFGSLERVMQIGLQAIGNEKINSSHSVLILGVGGGSVIKLLQDKFCFNKKIIGVELDPKVLEIANQYFGLNKRRNIEIKIDDASTFVKETPLTFDIIVIDIFQDNKMPDFLFFEGFLSDLHTKSNKNGVILFNSIVTLSSEFERNKAYYTLSSKLFGKVQKISNVEGNNELFILRK
jgi:spermidine synthase